MLYLASGSPRRRELLEQIGITATRLHVEVPEVLQPGESAEQFVRRLALEKARAGWLVLGAEDAQWPVLGADTVVVFEGEILGKPRDRAHGISMLTRLAGQRHEVLTAVALVRGEREQFAISRSQVTFAPLSARQIAAYWAGGEPADKAGAYAVQGLAASFISHLEGSYSGVMGLPLYETTQLLGQFGIDVI